MSTNPPNNPQGPNPGAPYYYGNPPVNPGGYYDPRYYGHGAPAPAYGAPTYPPPHGTAHYPPVGYTTAYGPAGGYPVNHAPNPYPGNPPYAHPTHPGHPTHPTHPAQPGPPPSQPLTPTKAALPAETLLPWFPDAGQIYHIDKWFSALDSSKSGEIGGGEVVSFLSKSHLPKQSLRDIWALVDVTKTGKLNKGQFTQLMRLVSVLASPLFMGSSPSVELFNKALKMDIPLPAQFLEEEKKEEAPKPSTQTPHSNPPGHAAHMEMPSQSHHASHPPPSPAHNAAQPYSYPPTAHTPSGYGGVYGGGYYYPPAPAHTHTSAPQGHPIQAHAPAPTPQSIQTSTQPMVAEVEEEFSDFASAPSNPTLSHTLTLPPASSSLPVDLLAGIPNLTNITTTAVSQAAAVPATLTTSASTHSMQTSIAAEPLPLTVAVEDDDEVFGPLHSAPDTQTNTSDDNLVKPTDIQLPSSHNQTHTPNTPTQTNPMPEPTSLPHLPSASRLSVFDEMVEADLQLQLQLKPDDWEDFTGAHDTKTEVVGDGSSVGINKLGEPEKVLAPPSNDVAPSNNPWDLFDVDDVPADGVAMAITGMDAGGVTLSDTVNGNLDVMSSVPTVAKAQEQEEDEDFGDFNIAIVEKPEAVVHVEQTVAQDNAELEKVDEDFGDFESHPSPLPSQAPVEEINLLELSPIHSSTQAGSQPHAHKHVTSTAVDLLDLLDDNIYSYNASTNAPAASFPSTFVPSFDPFAETGSQVAVGMEEDLFATDPSPVAPPTYTYLPLPELEDICMHFLSHSLLSHVSILSTHIAMRKDMQKIVDKLQSKQIAVSFTDEGVVVQNTQLVAEADMETENLKSQLRSISSRALSPVVEHYLQQLAVQRNFQHASAKSHSPLPSSPPKALWEALRRDLKDRGDGLGDVSADLQRTFQRLYLTPLPVTYTPSSTWSTHTVLRHYLLARRCEEVGLMLAFTPPPSSILTSLMKHVQDGVKNVSFMSTLSEKDVSLLLLQDKVTTYLQGVNGLAEGAVMLACTFIEGGQGDSGKVEKYYASAQELLGKIHKLTRGKISSSLLGVSWQELSLSSALLSLLPPSQNTQASAGVNLSTPEMSACSLTLRPLCSKTVGGVSLVRNGGKEYVRSVYNLYIHEGGGVF